MAAEEGIVEAHVPRGMYMVRLAGGSLVRAALAPEARRVLVKLEVGQGVLVQVSAFDTSRAQIIARI
jgi:translation initiation factor IF-1